MEDEYMGEHNHLKTTQNSKTLHSHGPHRRKNYAKPRKTIHNHAPLPT